jgi:uncharacterized protein (TIGR02246 family)
MLVNKCCNKHRGYILILLVTIFILPIGVLSQQQSTDIAKQKISDSTQIIAILQSWEASWNIHDMHAFANLFHEDAVWVLWTGNVWKGRTAIENGHASVHKTYFRNSIQKEELEELTFVGSEVAVVRFNSSLTGDERYPGQIIRSRKILVITKRNNIWKVGWGQNTRFAEATTK